MVKQNKTANNSVEIDSKNIIISLLLVNINRLIELEWGLFVTNENKASKLLLTVLKVNS